jgi:hypothetical protein
MTHETKQPEAEPAGGGPDVVPNPGPAPDPEPLKPDPETALAPVPPVPEPAAAMNRGPSLIGA